MTLPEIIKYFHHLKIECEGGCLFDTEVADRINTGIVNLIKLLKDLKCQKKATKPTVTNPGCRKIKTCPRTRRKIERPKRHSLHRH
jgi:hypothetical protein